MLPGQDHVLAASYWQKAGRRLSFLVHWTARTESSGRSSGHDCRARSWLRLEICAEAGRDSTGFLEMRRWRKPSSRHRARGGTSAPNLYRNLWPPFAELALMAIEALVIIGPASTGVSACESNRRLLRLSSSGVYEDGGRFGLKWSRLHVVARNIARQAGSRCRRRRDGSNAAPAASVAAGPAARFTDGAGAAIADAHKDGVTSHPFHIAR